MEKVPLPAARLAPATAAPVAPRWVAHLRRFVLACTPAWFSIPLATGGVAGLFAVLPYSIPGQLQAALAFFVLTCILFAAFSLLFTAK